MHLRNGLHGRNNEPECPVCGAEGALAENCGKYVEPAAEGEASQPEGEKTQEKQESDMPKIQSEAALAQMSGEGENGIAVQNTGIAINPTNFPDVNFRSFVAEKYDTDGYEYLAIQRLLRSQNSTATTEESVILRASVILRH